MPSIARAAAAAFSYARAGWPVFPCKPDAKVPATHHGCLDATTNEATIRWWWQRNPRFNVAIATGDPGPDVVDVDCKGETNGYEALGRLRRAGLLAGPMALVKTPTGGAHLYYAGSGQGNGKLARHGLDFRSRGGYVLAPPSVVDGKWYELVEHRAEGRPVDWQAIRRFLDPPRPAIANWQHGTGDLDALARWVEAQQPGNRNDGLFWAACRAVQSGHGDLDALVAAAVRTGLEEREARRTVQSATRRLGGAA